MGERTQLLIQVKDKKDNLLIGTVLHYQWGYGRTMLMDALNLIINFPWHYDLDSNNIMDHNNYPEIDTFLKNNLNIKFPVLARNLYSWLGNTSSGCNNIPLDFDKTEYNLKNQIESPYQNNISSLELAFHANQNDFANQCDNNDGYMIADIIFDRYIEKCEFKFCYNPIQLISLESYSNDVKQSHFLNLKFISAYKTICKSYDIKVD